MAKDQEVYRDWYGRQNDIPLPDRHKIHVPAIVLDCPTRWNSLYYMIRRGIVLCPILNNLMSLPQFAALRLPTAAEWKELESLCLFL